MSSTYTPIATTTLTNSTTGDFVFSSIPSNYTDLRVVISARGNNAGTTEGVWFYIGSYATDMSATNLTSTGATAASTRETNANQLTIGQIAGNTATSGLYTLLTLDVFNYANTTTFKTFLCRSNNGGTQIDSTGLVSATVGIKRNTVAVNSLTFFLQNGTKWQTGSTFSLYGIKAE
jgi:hypothetical protein